MSAVVCFDVETTGFNNKPGDGEDFIIQLSAAKFDKDTFEILDKRNWYIKPQHAYTITPGAFEKHHISKEFLDEHGASMADVAPVFLEFIDGCDILGYNSNKFDIQFIAKDLRLCGFEFPFEGKKFYDAFSIECKRNPRDLTSVYRKYTGKDLEDAHNALADVLATVEVFKNQMNDLTYDEIDSWDECAVFTDDNTITKKKTLYGEEIIFNFGKYRNVEFMKALDMDYGYVKWYLEKVASTRSKEILKQYYNERKKK